jgi:hypothetical protein
MAIQQQVKNSRQVNLWNKKHVKTIWHRVSRVKRVYQSRGKYRREGTINNIKYILNRKWWNKTKVNYGNKLVV